jgi:sugar fermentation stimulation protein A
MEFQSPLIRAKLIRRYKRFLSDVLLPDGREITAHCANPGSMMGLLDDGTIAWVEPNDDPKKKLKFAWRIAELRTGAMVLVDTAQANRIVKEALENNAIAEFANQDFRPEVKYGEGSRIDFLLTDQSGQQTFVEVKSVTLSRATGSAEFPDSVTARGTKHLQELSKVVEQGHRAMMFYLVNRTDCDVVSIAADIDPTYAAALDAAQRAGVEVIAYRADIAPNLITLGPRVAFRAADR